LFYASTPGSQSVVTVDIITPSLKKNGLYEMIYLYDSLYYLDVCFTELGSHVFTVFENGIKKHRDILLVSNSDLILYPED